MATALMPVDPASTPQRVNRLLTISASLLPEEISLARRARRTRGWVIVVVLLVMAMLGAWFFLANQDTQAADKELTDATGEVTALQRDQRDYAEVVDVQNDTQALAKQLQAVMKNDLGWARLLDTLDDTATGAGLTLDGINGALDAGTGSGTSTATTGSAAATIGTLTVTGSGPDKEAVAAYIEALGKQTLVADPYLTSVLQEDDPDSDEDKVTFGLTLKITSAALCGRFGDKCDSGGN
ncbi:PilN domain-containing protein [Symbioplanes lichenis]|uniref:PilN domain-containing protein n=1 Tax=Symbioplanes lichenis TaxID=1629072 RepID=UPI002739A0F7|nr:hypothetical protein [Actinoplanes lichenis]